MKTITLATQKGGTGKTTLATSLAVAAQEAGETVALFDLDPQGSVEAWGKVRKADGPHVEAFPADKVAQLPALMKALGGKGVTLAIIDTAGADNTATHKAMEAADLCLVPIRPTRLDAAATLPTVRALMRGETPFAFVLNQCPTTPRNARAAEVSAGLAALGADLGIAVTAEGVETASQRDVLVAEGCGEGQGFLWGKPLPFEQPAQAVGTSRLRQARYS